MAQPGREPTGPEARIEVRSVSRPAATLASSRGLVLDLVRFRGPISRVEIADLTGLTQGTISNVVRALLAEGLVQETGARKYTGGQPRVMLTLNPRSRFSVGVQLDADWIVVVVVDAAASVIARARVRGARSSAPPDVVSAVAHQVDVLLRATGIDPELVVGLGVAAPGILDLQAGTILVARTLEPWRDFPVQQALQEATGLQVYLDSDATAAAVGEFWGGGLEGSRAHCTVYMGASIGVGIVIDGSVYRGASSNTGPLGYMRMPGDRATRGMTVEELAGPRAIAERARAAIAAGRSSSAQLSLDGDPFSDFAAVANAAVLGDPLSLALIKESAEHLAAAVTTVVNLLDADSLVLAGPSFTIAGSIYLTIVRDQNRTDFVAQAKHDVSVELSINIADAAAVGAAALVLQHRLAPR
jgi:predicted NBD/HSP70 family sugar kinase